MLVLGATTTRNAVPCESVCKRLRMVSASYCGRANFELCQSVSLLSSATAAVFDGGLCVSSGRQTLAHYFTIHIAVDGDKSAAAAF